MSDIKMPQRWFRVYDTGWVKDCAGEWVKSEDVEPLVDEITRLRAGLQRIVEGDGFWDAPSLARDLLEGKDVT
jgi:hypothetical protein